MLAPEPVPLHLMKHRASYLHFVPRGVVGVIAPWNFPFSIPIGETIMALIAGNGVVLKPSRGHAADRAQGEASCTSRPSCRPICSRSSPGAARPARR